MKEINQDRASRIGNDTLVLYNGEWCYWGDLSGNERMMCEVDNLGMVIGGDIFEDHDENIWPIGIDTEINDE